MGDVLVQGLLTGGVYALIALGFVLVFKSSQVMNLAYGEIIAVLSYFLYQLLIPWEISEWIAIPLVIAAGAVLGFLVERLTIRPLLGRSFLAILMMTLMLGFFFKGIIVLVWSSKSFNYPFTPQGLWTIGGIQIIPAAAISFIAALLIFGMLMLLFRYTRVGLSMRVVAADHEVAQSLGIRVRRVFSLSWAISGAFAAICGILVGMAFTVTPTLGDIGMGKGLPVLLLGGLTSVPGALAGGIIIGVVEAVGGEWSPYLKEIVPWMVMLIILLIRPYGLFGQKRIERI